LTGVLFSSIPQQFFPAADSDFSMVRVSMVPGTTLRQTEEVVEDIAERLRQEPEVALALGIVNEGSGMVRLVFHPDRARTSVEFERQLTPMLQDIPDARVDFQDQQGGGGTGRAISIMLSGSDPEQLDAAANTLAEQMQEIDGLV